MNKKSMIPFLILFCCFPSSYADDLIQKIDRMKTTVSKAEADQRKLYKEILSTRHQIKRMSDERAQVNEKALASEANSQELAFQVKELEEKIRNQRLQIGKSVSQIYRLKNPSLLSFLFSEQSAAEIEKNVRFLSVLSKKDYENFLSHQKTLKEVKITRGKLNGEVKRLLSLREELKTKESRLLENQRTLSQVLNNIKDNKEKNMQLLKSLRAKLPELDQNVKVALFEKKGKLNSPLESLPTKTYGSQFDPVYRVKLLHLGWSFENLIPAPVKSVFQGKVVFVGSMGGFGNTIIIDHGDHYYSVYGYNQKNLVFEGEEVFPNQSIAQSGSKLYFELRHFSNAIDPAKWIAQEKTHQMASNEMEIYEESP